MKFTDGFWRNRIGVEVYNAYRVYDLEVDAASITAYAPYFDVSNRGQTLQGPLLTYRLSSPLEGVIRVQMWHYKGSARKGPFFSTATEDSQMVPCIEDNPVEAVLRSGGLEARLAKTGPWSLAFYESGRKLTDSGWKNSGYVRLADGSVYMKEQLAIDVGECIYGFGERFTAFVKNGQVVECWNADGGTSSELAYKNIPFYLSSKGYGVFVNECGRLSFEIGSEKVSRVQFSAPGEYLEYYVIAGGSPKKTIELYTALTARPALPPAWSFGLWLTTSFVTDYDEATVTSFVEGMAERKIPLSVFHYDCFWMREYHWCDFKWDSRFFPDPAGQLSRLKARGLRICVWINPYIAQRSSLFEEGARNGYLLKTKDGGVWQTDAWQPGMGIVDFTNKAAREWYAAALERLLDMGVDCFKTDFGEVIPIENVVWNDGSDPERMHNYYTLLYNETVFSLLERKRGRGEAVLFARSATAGGQKYPVHWGGDCTATYVSMAESLRGGLSLGLAGFGFWSHDISGFEHTATPDLYKRWAAFGLLSSHSRLHGNASYRVPWLFDEEAVDVVRFFARLKCRLMPYLYRVAVEAARTGVPMMRAMFLEFPDDPACRYLDRQYMLGDSLLVAPVFSETGEVEYYLPEGSWTNLIRGDRIEGGRWLREKHGYLSLPLLVREGALIAFGACDDRPDYEWADNATLGLYGLRDGESVTAEVPKLGASLYAGPALAVTIQRSGSVYYVNSSGVGLPWSLELVGGEFDKPLGSFSAEGARLEKRAGSIIAVPSAPGTPFIIKLTE
jgi:alpha-D-xyloside xylohydrolase